jgi:hypothetical protein
MNRSAWWLIRDRNIQKRNSNHAADFGFRRRSLADAEAFEVLIVADNPEFAAFHYPDSNRQGLRHPRMFFRPDEVDYWDGEE